MPMILRSHLIVLTSFIEIFYSGGKLRLPNKLRNAITNFHGTESFELNEDINRFTVAVFQDNWSRALSAIKRQI